MHAPPAPFPVLPMIASSDSLPTTPRKPGRSSEGLHAALRRWLSQGMPRVGIWGPLMMFIFFGAGGIVLPSATLQAQEIRVQIPPEGATQLLQLRDGSVLYGRVVSPGDPFGFRLISGQELTVAVADVRRLGLTRGEAVDGEFWFADPNQTRLFFGPTGRVLDAGDGYLSVFELLFPILAYGLTDHVTVAAGTPLIFGGLGGRPFWFAPRVAIRKDEDLSLSAGVLAFVTTESTESVGILYSAATVGDARQSVHLGIGYGYDRGGLASTPAFMLGGEIRTSRNLKFLTENYLLPGEAGILSAGVRFMGERLSAELGLASPVGTGGSFFAFPLVSFTWSW
ncbi:hypothetical protein BH23GEM11_BH23GEM11_06100 [soil metagenome]